MELKLFRVGSKQLQAPSPFVLEYFCHIEEFRFGGKIKKCVILLQKYMILIILQ